MTDCTHPDAVGLGDAPKGCIRFYCDDCLSIIVESIHPPEETEQEMRGAA